ncbi:MAG: tryptophan synthase subunit alpha [Actinobacteria bacterium]|nr:tryptophan synthase subunit alpha [Actinomycetota bacterium]
MTTPATPATPATPGTPAAPLSPVAQAFEKAASEQRAAVVGYLPAGFPSVDGAITAAVAMAESGVDVLEIGLPYSDPLIDGPVIQEAVHAALTNGTHVGDVLRTVEAATAAGVPTLVMTYWNPIDHYGVAAFARDLAAAGGAGLITPDLPPEEAGPWIEASDRYGLDRVFLVAPSSTRERIQTVTAVCRGFVYAASLMGITGTRATVSDQAAGLVSKVRDYTRLPVAVGLGVRDGAQAAQVAGFADGVIVGTAFVQRLLNAPSPDEGIAAVRALAADLAAGARAGSQAAHASPAAPSPAASPAAAANPAAAAGS